MDTPEHSQDILFEEPKPLDFNVRATVGYWRLISEIKHPSVADRLEDVKQALARPVEVWQSRRDPSVFLFFNQLEEGRWICAVAKQLDGEGFLVTSYVTENIKEGQRIWPR